MFELSIFGRGGQGIVTAAAVIADAALREGAYPQKTPVYGAARRGDTVKAFVRIGAEPVMVRSPISTPDCVLICDASIALAEAARGLTTLGALVLNDADEGKPRGNVGVRTMCRVDANAVSRDVFGPRPIPLTGIVMVGAFLRAVPVIGEASVREALGAYFSLDMLERNVRAMQEGRARASLSSNEVSGPDHLYPPAAWYEMDLVSYRDLAPGPMFVPSSLAELKAGSWRSRRPTIDAGRCRACGRCVPVCPEGAIVEREKEIFVDGDYCKGCGICAGICAREAITMIEEV